MVRCSQVWRTQHVKPNQPEVKPNGESCMYLVQLELPDMGPRISEPENRNHHPTSIECPITITIIVRNLHAPSFMLHCMNQPRYQNMTVDERNTPDTIIFSPSSLLFLESLLDSSVAVLIPFLSRVVNVPSTAESITSGLPNSQTARAKEQISFILIPDSVPECVARMLSIPTWTGFIHTVRKFTQVAREFAC
jgi:hypothetical protein